VNSKTLSEARRNLRGGQISHLLLGPDEPAGERLSVTWVECGPGSRQPAHRHPASQQVYVIVQGTGRMFVGGESQTVTRGTLVVVPEDTEHYIENVGDGTLVYVSATAPPFDLPRADSAFAYR
jgi:mannose-6-phosphate isomerase-like protein (cupin superfamily)